MVMQRLHNVIRSLHFGCGRARDLLAGFDVYTRANGAEMSWRGFGSRWLRRRGTRQHRVPLALRALEVLAAARALAPRSPLVFPGRTGRPLCGRTLSVLAGPLGCVPHGFRTSFRNWCGETGVPREVAERCLAHVVRNQVERAYSRTDLLERRRKVMEDWAQYITP